MKKYISELADYLEGYVHDRSISFIRVDPRSFITMIYRMFTPFCPGFRSIDLRRGMKQKVLYCLWNTVIDDTIEYMGKGRKAIIESLAILSQDNVEKNHLSPETEAGLIMRDFMREFYALPETSHASLSREMLFLDLVRIINGFDYERIIHDHTTMGTLSEYMEFSTATIDVRVFLDIDLAVYGEPLNLSTIGDLREAYHWFDSAIKLSSDIATFQREFMVEASQNAVILRGQQDGSLPRNILTATKEDKRHFEKEISVLMNQVKKEGRNYLIKALHYLEEIEEVDTREIAAVFTTAFEEYPGMKMFSFPGVNDDRE
jgi:hypothetical protein